MSQEHPQNRPAGRRIIITIFVIIRIIINYYYYTTIIISICNDNNNYILLLNHHHYLNDFHDLHHGHRIMQSLCYYLCHDVLHHTEFCR